MSARRYNEKDQVTDRHEECEVVYLEEALGFSRRNRKLERNSLSLFNATLTRSHWGARNILEHSIREKIF